MRHYKVKTIQALERGVQVMAALREMRAASLHDLHLNTGIPKPTLTRILYTLYRQGLVWQRMAEREVAGHELARDPVAMRRILEATRRRGFSVRAPDFGGHYSKTRREADDGRNSIAMPIGTGGHVLGCVNLTWRRKALTLTEVVQRYAGDLRTAVTTIENRLAENEVRASSAPAT